ncbi:outer membrane beta-barrel protein [Marivirga sp.]|uniref:outer membrane beta-barrel protein n=1 Tax=Marivirga sp. TaxID=2018662 RepID=UPI0025F39E42|nr:outer membrane beta-barrel protein [Marivirga sp.]
MKSLVITLLLFGGTFHLQAQSTINGKVKDKNNEPVPYVNVLLLNKNDSSLVKGAVSDDIGKYTIYNVPVGTYLLAASMVGYEKSYGSSLTVEEELSEITSPPLTLADDVQQLEEITVKTTRPFIEKKIDRTVVNVANSIVSSGSTGLEVLEKAPGVFVDQQNNSISLMGKSGVIVQIDGRRTNLSITDVVTMLRSTSSDNIDKIELITNPSAKHDAEGNAGIINIVMKENNSIGTNGSVSLSGGTGRYDRERGSLQLNHRSEKINLFGSYSANRGGNYLDFDLYRNQADGDIRNIIEQEMYIKIQQMGQNVKGGVDYFVGENTTLGVVWNGFWNNRTDRIPEASTTFRRQESGPLYRQTLSEISNSNALSNQMANLNLQHSFGNDGEITADVNFGRFNSEMNSDLITATILPEDPGNEPEGLVIQMPVTIDVLTFKTDYNRSLSETWKMETGYKSSSVKSDNNLSLSNGSIGEMERDPELSNHFQYTERVNAAYASIKGNPFTKTEMQLGLRAEHTYSLGESLSLNERVERDYLNLFPSLFVSRELSEKQNLTFSYSHRIDRPNYRSLNPARWYLDPYSFERGNPFLNPQYTHSLELQHGFKNQVFTSFGASFINDVVVKIVQPVDNQKAERIPQNVGTSQVYSMNLSFPISVMKAWELQTNLVGLYSRFEYLFQGVPLEVEQFSGRININNSIKLGKGWRGEVSGWVNTPGIQAMFVSGWQGTLNVGIQKAFNEKWQAKLNMQDILHTNQFIMYGEAAGFTQNYRIRRDTRLVMLRLSYSFGNQKLKRARQRKTGSEDEMSRTN